MELLSEILGQFIGVGVIILVIVFQQELRKFLIMIGKGKLIKNKGFFKFNIGEEEKITVSPFIIETSGCFPFAILTIADDGSPWLPVATITNLSSGNDLDLLSFMIVFSGA